MKTKPQQHRLRNTPYVVTLRKVRNARRITLSVKKDTSIVVTMPSWASYHQGKQFAEDQKEWITEKVKVFSQIVKKRGPLGTRDHYLTFREEARAFIQERLEHWNTYYGYRYARVFVRNQTSVWGSCSSNKNLNFNYSLYFLPKDLADYVIVHELCHLKELNHGPRFWKLVEEVMPDYEKRKKRLRDNFEIKFLM